MRRLTAMVALVVVSSAAWGQNERIVEWSPSTVVDPNDDILAMGYPVPIPVDTPLPFDGFRTYNGLRMRHNDLVATTDWVHRHEVGSSQAGTPIYAYRLGDADTLMWNGLPEPAMLTNGGTHAREWQSPETTTAIMELLSSRGDDDGFYRYLLDNVNMTVIPILNVDGFRQTQRYPRQNWLGTDPGSPDFSPRDGRMRRKNMNGPDTDITTQGDHLLGIDLNRNNPPFWATSTSSSGDPESIVYHGTAPHSEPETQALAAAALLGPEDQLRLYTDVHSFGQVQLWSRTPNQRLTNQFQAVFSLFGNYHASLPAGRFYAFGNGAGQDPNSGIGTTGEYFARTYGIPGYTLEIEPRNGSFWQGVPTEGADYGGVSENGHDGFIMPESQIRRAREGLAEAFAGIYFRQAGPPSITNIRFYDDATGALVFESAWDVASETTRTLHTFQPQELQLGRQYTAEITYDKPMRWRVNGAVAPYPGQPGSNLNINGGTFVGATQMTSVLGTLSWANTPGTSPGSYHRYRDDTLIIPIRFPANANNSGLVNGPTAGVINNGTMDITGMMTDANPATIARWGNGAWVDYEGTNGAQGDVGGTDSTVSVQFTNEVLGDPFVLQDGISGAWYDPQRNGEGFFLEILPGGSALVYWFTYDDNGEQDWYISVGTIIGNRIEFNELLRVSGGVFGPNFDPDLITTEAVGSAEFTWDGCGTGTMNWRLGPRAGRMELQRITSVMTLECDDGGPQIGTPPPTLNIPEAQLSGSWFDPTHNGEGYTFQVLPSGDILLYWFSFDPNGNRRWFFGVGTVENGTLVFEDMTTTRGPSFGAGYDPNAVEVLEWGTLELDIDCDGGPATYNSTEAGFGSGTLNIERITTLAGLSCSP